MEIGLVEKVDIDHEMQQAYLDYAMSVIVSRALPDARDGLKPVHRRILYAMYDMGLRPDSPYKKSARIVGEVLGKYHPHGDMAVYEAMARMAQDFSMRYLLVDGQGNFGSVDGDSPAAMRYTEARLAPPSQNLLADIQKNTVNFSPNFDGSLSEPDVLPAALPNLLINGATGIAVGMSTSIPPHNLGEVVDALKFMLGNWTKLEDINVEDLMRFIQGPDFPTGGVIIQETGEEDLHTAYGSGRGRVIVQAHARLEEMERGRSRIIVTELPYMTNKASLIERIAELVREEKLEGIADLRDESDRHGMRIVIELTKTADPEAVLRDLYKHTPMQGTFSIIMLALVDGEPRMLSLKQALRVYLEHRLEIVKRRSQYELEKARQRAHILEGLRIALKNLDEVIDLIRKAPDAETARERLMKRFKLTEIQAQAILDLQLRRLASLERKKIEQEYKDVLALIKELESLLRSPVKMRTVIAEELQAVKDAYGDRRRTQIVRMKAGESRRTLLSATDLVQSQPVWVSVTPEGLISRTLEDRMPRLNGNNAPAWLVRTNSRDTLYLVCEKGEAAALSVHSLPQNENPAEGVPFWKVTALHEGDRLASLLSLPPKADRGEGWYVLTVTRLGMIKKTDLSELPGPSASGFTLVKVNEGDRLFSLRLTNGAAEILLATASGMAIRFSEEEVRPMGLVAAGVMGIKLSRGDEIAGMEVLPQPGDVFMISSEGGAKRVPIKDFPRQGRYGQGVVSWKLSGKARLVGLAVGKGTARATLHLEKLAPKSIRFDDAPLGSRTTRGNILPDVKGNLVLMLTVPWNPPRPGTGASGLVGLDGGEPDGDGSIGKKGRGGSSRSGRGGGPKAPEQNGRPEAPEERLKGAAAASSKAYPSSEPTAVEKTPLKKAALARDTQVPAAKPPRARSKPATQAGELVKEKATRKPTPVKQASSADIADELIKTARITKKAPPIESRAKLKAGTSSAPAKPAPTPKKAAPTAAKTTPLSGGSAKGKAVAGKSSPPKESVAAKSAGKTTPQKAVSSSTKPVGKASSPKAATARKPAVGKTTPPKTAPEKKPAGKPSALKAAPATKSAAGKSTPPKAASISKPAAKTNSPKAAPAPTSAVGKPTTPKSSPATKPVGNAAKPASKASSPKPASPSPKTAGKSTPPKATSTSKTAGKTSSAKSTVAAQNTPGKKKKAPPVGDAGQLTLLDLGPAVQKSTPKGAPRKKPS